MKHEQCGAFKHKMTLVPTDWTPTFGNPITLRCDLCGSERRIQQSNSGKIITSRYVHPDGYKDWYPKGQRPSPADFRAALFETTKHSLATQATAQDALAERRAQKGKTA